MRPPPSGQPHKRSGSEKRQRGRPVSVRLLPSERAELEMKARTAGLSMGSYLRACYLGSPGPRAKRSPPVNAELFAMAIAQLNRVGNNINQIARVLNREGPSAANDNLTALAEMRAVVVTAVVRILDIVGWKDRA